MLHQARKKHFHLKLVPVDILRTSKDDATLANLLTKFNASRLTDYSRVLYLDSDFLAPMSRPSVPHAYWLGAADIPSQTRHCTRTSSGIPQMSSH